MANQAQIELEDYVSETDAITDYLAEKMKFYKIPESVKTPPADWINLTVTKSGLGFSSGRVFAVEIENKDFR
jgi:hypothetical protein